MNTPCFNPLDRGNLYQMLTEDIVRKIVAKFQYPRSGNLYQINMDGKVFDASMTKFQSPRSGKFVSNLFLFF